MYVSSPADESRRQARLIVNMVLVVFLLIGLLLMLQYFHFLYLRDIPLIGNWLMDVYERVFGVPKVLILHGDDSIGNWEELRSQLSKRLIFYSEDVDVRKFSAGMGQKLKEYGLVIVEDAKRLDKDKLINLDDYVRSGGNLIWVGDAGTIGYVEYEDRVLANQTGWTRNIVCIDEKTLAACSCKTVRANSTCKFLPDEAEQVRVDFSATLGVDFSRNVIGDNPILEIVDRSNWAVMGIRLTFPLSGTNKITKVANSYDSSLVANVKLGEDTYPGIVINDQPGVWGSVIYFAYPPEKTMEILLPIVERLRY